MYMVCNHDEIQVKRVWGMNKNRIKKQLESIMEYSDSKLQTNIFQSLEYFSFRIFISTSWCIDIIWKVKKSIKNINENVKKYLFQSRMNNAILSSSGEHQPSKRKIAGHHFALSLFSELPLALQDWLLMRLQQSSRCYLHRCPRPSFCRRWGGMRWDRLWHR